MTSASGSRLRADAKPYMPAVEPAPVPPCAFPDGDDDHARMPAWLSELFEDPPIEEVAPGGYTPLLLPSDENSSRAFVKKFISGHLSKVSKEVDESLVDYVNAFDPCQVAAQVEALLFERWGLFDLSKPVSGKYCVFLSRLADDGIKDLRRHILLGEITQEELANMSIIEMWRKYPEPNRIGALEWEF